MVSGFEVEYSSLESQKQDYLQKIIAQNMPRKFLSQSKKIAHDLDVKMDKISLSIKHFSK